MEEDKWRKWNGIINLQGEE